MLVEAQPRRVTPHHQYWKQLRHVGTITGELGFEENFGEEIHSIGDCNNDGYDDFLVARFLADTSFPLRGKPRQLLLYLGNPGGIFKREDGVVIGPVEVGSYTWYLGHGDFDNDGNTDIACRFSVDGDTSYGNVNRQISRKVIFWGDGTGEYGTHDTTWLRTGSGIDFAYGQGGVWDYNHDGIDDIVVSMLKGNPADTTTIQGNAYDSTGAPVFIPGFQMWRGRTGSEWRADTASHRADFVWWTAPYGHPSVKPYDVDCDDVPDLVFSYDYQHGRAPGGLSILYGHTVMNGVVDTTAVQQIPFGDSVDPSRRGVRSGRLIDVTGDNVLDCVLLTNRFEEQRILVYPGEPGTKMEDVLFASTGDTTVWKDPWASLETPFALHDGWSDVGNSLYDLGDGNLDGYDDIWALAAPLEISFTIFYSTNKGLDSLFDGYYRSADRYPKAYANVGHIDSTGIPTIAVGYVSLPRDESGIMFLKPNDSIPYRGKFRSFPHQADVQRCFSTVSVANESVSATESSTLAVTAEPNPGAGEVRISWQSATSVPVGECRHSEVAVFDLLGRTVRPYRRTDANGSILWSTRDVGPGHYVVVVSQCDVMIGSVRVTVRD